MFFFLCSWFVNKLKFWGIIVDNEGFFLKFFVYINFLDFWWYVVVNFVFSVCVIKMGFLLSILRLVKDD